MARLRLPLLVLLASFALLACSGGGARPNVLLITLDTTRADRLGCYGYAKAQTPALDALAASGARFEHAYAQVPLTLASHATLLTGKYPATTGLRINADAKLPQGVRTLAESFQERGYRTGAFVSAFVLDSTFGLDRGFEVYDDNLVRAGASRHFEVDRSGDAVTDAALAWLDGAKAERFFAWVHLYDPHAPYRPPPEYRARFADPYDGEIAFADSQVRRLLDWLDGAGLRENTLVIVAGDHGESFLEHGEPEHGLFVYDTTIRVPLILSWPGNVRAGAVSTANVQLLDVYSTVLELVGAPADRSAAGSSFAAGLRGETLPERTVFGESTYPQHGYGWAPLRYLVRGDLKYIDAPRPELYDRRADPGETDNRLDQLPNDAATLRASLLELTERIEATAPEPAELDAEAQAKLRSLGYVSGSSADAAASSGRDPKDMVDVFVGHDRALVLLGNRRYEEAAALLEGLLVRSPESIALNEELGTAYLSLNRLDDALRAFETSLRHTTDDPDRMWGHAEVLRRLGRTDEAIRGFEQAVARWPSLGDAYLGLALCHVSRGDFARAYEPARKHAELAPGSILALGNLANVCLALHKYDEAVATADRILELDARSTEGHYVRWEALRAAGKPREAIAALRDSRSALPSDWLLTCSLAWMLAVTPDAGGEPGAGDEAVRLAQTCVKLNPHHPRSFDVLGAAHAARGSYADAAKAARQALALAEGPQAAQARDAIEARIALYDAGQPFRE